MSTTPYQHYSASTFTVDESVGYLLRQIAGIMGGIVDERMAAHGLTDAQWKPLLILSQGKCQTAAELARVACCDAGAVTRLLDRIEGKGLIQRTRSQADRRVVNLELTDDGRQTAAVIPQVLATTLNEVLTGFSPEEVVLLKSLLRRLLDNARQLRAGAACGDEA